MPQPSKSYILFFGNTRIGHVAYEDGDFPNVWGQLTLDSRLSNPTTAIEQRLARFLKLNRESMRLLDVSREQDVSTELDAANRQLAEEFNDYIETDDWRLVDDSGAVHPILCPVLNDGDELVWRWNPKTE